MWTYLSNFGCCTMRSETHLGAADATDDAERHTALVPFRPGGGLEEVESRHKSMILQTVLTLSTVRMLEPPGW